MVDTDLQNLEVMANFLVIKVMDGCDEELNKYIQTYKKTFPPEWDRYLTLLIPANLDVSLNKSLLKQANIVHVKDLEKEFTEVEYIFKSYPNSINMNFLHITGIEKCFSNV